MIQKNDVQRVGVLVVHGIGEQRQFEHLEEVVRNIASALQADSDINTVQVDIKVSKDAPYRSSHQTWRAEGTATATIEVIDKSDKQTSIEFREVWWSDLDEPTSFKTFLSFWVWGLSLWTKPQYKQRCSSKNPGQSLPLHPERRLPEIASKIGETSSEKGVRIRLLHRVYLFIVSFVILLLLPFLWILGRVLRSLLGFEIRPDLLVDYLGDVKLYQQDAREGKGPLVDLGKAPPRFSIRRRFIKALVEMSLDKYDRWYVLSHSLGTLVAFNGLMELETALPRYLDEKLWERWSNRETGTADECHTDEYQTEKPMDEERAIAQAELLPQRPSWLSPDNTDIIKRRELFCRLRGFMTYGSPLSKFAVLWPLVVPLNQDEKVFSSDFEWINVFDPTDPVSDFTRFFSSKGENSSLTPRDIPYKAGQIHLLSHGQYLTFNPKRKNPLVRQVSRWILTGETFQEPQEPDNKRDKFFYRLGWPIPKVGGKDSPVVSFYFGLGIFIWFLLGVIISVALSWLVPRILKQVPKLLEPLELKTDVIDNLLEQIEPPLHNPFFYVATIAIVVVVVGTVVGLLGLNVNKGVQPQSRQP